MSGDEPGPAPWPYRRRAWAVHVQRREVVWAGEWTGDRAVRVGWALLVAIVVAAAALAAGSGARWTQGSSAAPLEDR